MQTKLFAVKGHDYHIHVMAYANTSDDATERSYFQSEGFDERTITVVLIQPGAIVAGSYDMYSWWDVNPLHLPDEIMKMVHGYIQDNFSDMESGSLIEIRLNDDDDRMLFFEVMGHKEVQS